MRLAPTPAQTSLSPAQKNAPPYGAEALNVGTSAEHCFVFHKTFQFTHFSGAITFIGYPAIRRVESLASNCWGIGL